MAVHATIGGKTGSFAVRATGMYDGTVRTTWDVVEGSGTRGLAGIKGTGGYFLPKGHKDASEAVLEVEFAS
ncbi:hypothetical protein CC85DRAFT_284501 [Cutaneotrichosporon oleaginosum]|uniref:DUF3224 domain-containing protein n=1 Tax=Cutaneotrichosporon oleaginosum TaxID=879819 RepID=A0A0J0XR31_9TREE|nr:uncharacterized protein CC85DRAFT_284501 [Cutaneotrichosporon oleaginosum]KLT43576.1 hypothetical protein CC85DRAFT_284501 [Cutaneotrichosporon oleaginosum]TXT05526.1 hypothetical protein COLE_06846 [Cutaneotrichosporon oleaginosum]